jgi:hypothetical protein
VSFLLITSHYGDIWQKKPSKIENKTQPSLCLQTWLQQNLRISTNHKYRLYMDVFLQPDVLKPDVLWVYRLKPTQTTQIIVNARNRLPELENYKPTRLLFLPIDNQ